MLNLGFFQKLYKAELLFVFFITPVFSLQLEKAVEQDPPNWMLEQIQEDFKDVVLADLLPEKLEEIMQAHYESNPLLVRFQIMKGKVFFMQSMVQDGAFVNHLHAFCELASRVKLPDCDFIMTFHDNPPENLKVPIFCSSKHQGTKKAILLPDYHTLMREKFFQEEAMIGSEKFSWEKKKNIAFFRGASTGGNFTYENHLQYPRFILAKMSLDAPDLVDARLTNTAQGASRIMDKIPEYFSHPVGIRDHMEYKYQVNVDGNSSAWSRVYWQLFSNCVMIKQDSPYIQWYYRELKPFVHYIPVDRDLHNLREMLQWAKEHDDKALCISKNARTFANENLQHDDQLYYIFLALSEYSKIQNGR